MSKPHDREAATAILAPDYLTKAQSRDDELVRRLAVALKQLESMDQTDEQPQELLPLSKQLGASWLLSHRHKAIKTLVAGCLAEILRLFAPEPPYDSKQIKAIFSLFIQQLRMLHEADTNFPRRFALLESLATLKMAVPLVDVCRADGDYERDDSLLMDLLSAVLEADLPSGVTTHPEPFLIDIASTMLMELDVITPAMLDCLLKRLLNAEKDMNPRGYTVAQEIIRLCYDRLLPPVSELLTHTNAFVHSELSDRKTTHELIQQLASLNPGFLLYTLPYVCRDLLCEEDDARTAAVALCGALFTSTPSLATQFHKNFLEFLQRFGDKSPSIRCSMVNYGVKLLLSGTPATSTVIDELKRRVTDHDFSVRFAVVKAVCDVVCDSSLNALPFMPADLLYEVMCRSNDRKSEVQLEAITGTAQMFHVHITKQWLKVDDMALDMSPSLSASLSKLMAAPAVLLSCYGDCESPFIRHRILQVLEKAILSHEQELLCRGRTLVAMWSSLTSLQQAAFATVAKDKRTMTRAVERFLQARKDRGTAPESTDITNGLLEISKRLPNPDHAFDLLQRFQNDYKDKAIFAGLERLCQPALTLKDSLAVVEDVTQRIATRGDKEVLSVLKIVLRLVSKEFIDSSVVSALLRDLSEGDIGLFGSLNASVEPPIFTAESIDGKQGGLDMLLSLSHHYPELFLSNIDILVSLGTTDAVGKSGSSRKSLTPKEQQSITALKLLSATLRHTNKTVSSSAEADRLLSESQLNKLAKLVPVASTAHAKAVGKCIGAVLATLTSLDCIGPGGSRFSDACVRLMRDWNSKLSTSTPQIISLLSEIALIAPVWFLANRGVDALQFAESQTSVPAVKLTCNYVRGLCAALPTVSVSRKAQLQGELKGRTVGAWTALFSGLGSAESSEKAALGRLAIRMCRHTQLDTALTADQWLVLARLPEDDESEVCRSVCATVMKELNRTALPVRFLAVAMLCNDSYSPLRGSLQSELRVIVRKYRLRHSAAVAAAASTYVHPATLYKLSPLACLPFAIHLLAHLPSCPSADDYKSASDVTTISRRPQSLLSLLLDALVFDEAVAGGLPTTGTIASMLHMLKTMRLCEDVVEPSNTCMHINGELATRILKSKIKDVSSLEAPSTQVYLPPTFFRQAIASSSAPSAKLPETVLPESPEVAAANTSRRRGNSSPLKRATASAKPAAVKSRTIALDSDSDSDELADSDSDTGSKKRRVSGASSSKENTTDDVSTNKRKGTAKAAGKKTTVPQNKTAATRPRRSQPSISYVEGSSDEE